jgi:hypothetical protein
LYHRIQKIGGLKIYKESNIFRSRIKMVLGLAFHTAKEVLKEYEQLPDNTLIPNEDQLLVDLIIYFGEFFIYSEKYRLLNSESVVYYMC